MMLKSRGLPPFALYRDAPSPTAGSTSSPSPLATPSFPLLLTSLVCADKTGNHHNQRENMAPSSPQAPSTPNIIPPTPTGLGIDSETMSLSTAFPAFHAATVSTTPEKPASPFNFQPTVAKKSPIIPKPVSKMHSKLRVSGLMRGRTNAAAINTNTPPCPTRFSSSPHSAHRSLFPLVCQCQLGKSCTDPSRRISAVVLSGAPYTSPSPRLRCTLPRVVWPSPHSAT